MALILMAVSTAAPGTEMVYVPVNPMFGGSPLHGSHLLSTAQATNRYKDR